MFTNGISTRSSGMLYAAPSRVENKAVENRVRDNEAVTNRVVTTVEDRVEANPQVGSRLDIAA